MNIKDNNNRKTELFPIGKYINKRYLASEIVVQEYEAYEAKQSPLIAHRIVGEGVPFRECLAIACASRGLLIDNLLVVSDFDCRFNTWQSTNISIMRDLGCAEFINNPLESAHIQRPIYGSSIQSPASVGRLDRIDLKNEGAK